MGARQRDYAKREQARLRFLLGGKCTHCGTTENLEFDCISPMGHDHHGKELNRRMSFYKVQFALGNLQILCKICNNKKSEFEKGLRIAQIERDREEQARRDNEPF